MNKKNPAIAVFYEGFNLRNRVGVYQMPAVFH